ncbi:hypothetical protein [Romboutsia sp.]|uniref:hypothetical protein n=1 Tax=Romboutsia sp. TaxID=1965302 RepID=UPI003F3C9D52
MSINNPNLSNDYNTQSHSNIPCNRISKTLPNEFFNISKSLLPPIMFDPTTGRLRDDATKAMGNLGFIESLVVKDKLIDKTVSIDISPKCTQVKATAKLRRLDLIMTIGYNVILLNSYHNSDPLNSNQILGILSNFTTVKVDDFVYLSPDDDFTKYTLPENYKLNFILKAEPDKYAPVDIPFVGFISQGGVYAVYIGPTT